MKQKPTLLELAEVKSAGDEREVAIAQIAAFLKKNPRSARHLPDIRKAHAHPVTQLQMLQAAAMGDDIADGIVKHRREHRTFH